MFLILNIIWYLIIIQHENDYEITIMYMVFNDSTIMTLWQQQQSLGLVINTKTGANTRRDSFYNIQHGKGSSHTINLNHHK